MLQQMTAVICHWNSTYCHVWVAQFLIKCYWNEVWVRRAINIRCCCLTLWWANCVLWSVSSHDDDDDNNNNNNNTMLMNGTIWKLLWRWSERRPVVCVLLGLLKYSYVVLSILLLETGNGASDSGMNYVLATRFTTFCRPGTNCYRRKHNFDTVLINSILWMYWEWRCKSSTSKF